MIWTLFQLKISLLKLIFKCRLFTEMTLTWKGELEWKSPFLFPHNKPTNRTFCLISQQASVKNDDYLSEMENIVVQLAANCCLLRYTLTPYSYLRHLTIFLWGLFISTTLIGLYCYCQFKVSIPEKTQPTFPQRSVGTIGWSIAGILKSFKIISLKDGLPISKSPTEIR